MERESIPYLLRESYVSPGTMWCVAHQNFHYGDSVRFVGFGDEQVPVCVEYWLREVSPKPPEDPDVPCMQRGCRANGEQRCRVCGMTHCAEHLVGEMCEECRVEAGDMTGGICTNFPSCKEIIFGRCDVCRLPFCDKHMSSKDLCEWCHVALMSGGGKA